MPRALGESTEAILLQELVAIQKLASRFASRHQEHVVAHQCRRIQKPDEPIDHHGEGNGVVVDGLGERDLVAGHVDEYLGEGCADQVQRKQSCGRDKGEEVAVVAPSDAIVQPHAMMVGGLDAVIAHPAVVGARRAPDLTCLTVFGRDFHSRGRGLG